MMLRAWALAAAVVAAAVEPHGRGHGQTRAQAAAWARLSAVAARESALAAPRLLELVNSTALREVLRVAKMRTASNSDARDLVAALRREARAAEVVHGFASDPRRSRFCDLSLDLLGRIPRVLNVWEAGVADEASCREKRARLPHAVEATAWADVEIYGAAPFKRRLAPTRREAGDRVLYASHNAAQVASGAFHQFGDVALVLKKTALAGAALLAPVDTGLYRRLCRGGPHGNASESVEARYAEDPERGLVLGLSCADGACLRCGAWRGAVGTLDALDHVLVAAAELQVASAAGVAEHPGAILGRLFFARNAAFLDEGLDADALPPLVKGAPEAYVEVGILATPPADAVAYAIGRSSLRARAGGDALRRVSAEYGWPLFWAAGDPGAGGFHSGRFVRATHAGTSRAPEADAIADGRVAVSPRTTRAAEARVSAPSAKRCAGTLGSVLGPSRACALNRGPGRVCDVARRPSRLRTIPDVRAWFASAAAAGARAAAGRLPAPRGRKTRIYNVGLMKTGTTSLHSAVKAALTGGTACKWRPKPLALEDVAAFVDDPSAAGPLNDALADCALLSDNPWWALFPVLAVADPDATFLATRRSDCGAWVDSVAGLGECFAKGGRRADNFAATGYADLHGCAFGEVWPTPATRKAWLAACENHAAHLDAVTGALGVGLVHVPLNATDAEKWSALDAALRTPQHVANARAAAWPRNETTAAKRGCT